MTCCSTGPAPSSVVPLSAAPQKVPLAGGGAPAPSAQTTLPGTGIQIPASGTVLTLNGMNFNLTDYVDDQFGGMFKRAPYERVKVDYPASLFPDSIEKGVAALDRHIKSTPGPKIILAHSQGAQVASRWMREHANDPDAPPPGEVTFILTGNPLRSTGTGRAVAKGSKEVDGRVAQPTPTDTPWPIIDVARREDGWANWALDESDTAAVAAAKRGMFLAHPHYEQVRLDDPTNAVWRTGNTTYVLAN